VVRAYDGSWGRGMNTTRLLQKQMGQIGYSTIERDYLFSDVFASSPVDRTVPVAAFTHSPPSYRNAALAVLDAGARRAVDVVSEHRALGACLFFVIEGQEVGIWQTHSKAEPQQIARASIEDLPALFAANSETWSPLSIQRAKSIGAFDHQYQLSFVDLGLMPAIESEIHVWLDRLLNRALEEAIDSQTGRTKNISERSLFRAVFRFLTAKILQDGSHELSRSWDPERVETILDQISSYYTLDSLPVQKQTAKHKVLTSVWARIREGINFQNISPDNLAFVYENTLVTPEIRKRLGTHSTPRQVAEYVVTRLNLHKHAPHDLKIYEPFAGASVFLVSALRALRERLPLELTDAQRHEFLVRRISGDEIDSFACEVSMLSLILADYPMQNGWHIREANLFQANVLEQRMRASNVILCNPPFEDFSDSDRKLPIAQSSHSQAVAVLNTALDSHPLALGFVLPGAFIRERKFAQQRARVEQLYSDVELVQVPDRVFGFSDVDCALLIAREQRTSSARSIKLRSTEVADDDRERFLERGEPTTARELIRPVSDKPTGELWIPALGSVWRYLDEFPRLGEGLRPRWGLRWKYKQANAWSEKPREGFVPGVMSARSHKQFFAGRPGNVDFRLRYLREAHDQPWEKPKIIMNATRLSRGPWRIGAFADFKGLRYSQQFFGLWPQKEFDRRELLALSAILNGPIANAFIAAQAPDFRFRVDSIERIPIPSAIPAAIGDLVTEYIGRLNRPQLFDDPRLGTLLCQIDAEVLKAYDLPPRLERELLEFFRNSERPVVHEWHHWFPENFQPFIPLHEYVSDEYQDATKPWERELFAPLPEDEAEGLRRYMG
jgi:hypothetical protein